jgi:hypothetical protein
MWWNQNGNLEDIAGLGYVDGVCRPNYKFSISEEAGAFLDATTYVHEIGNYK